MKRKIFTVLILIAAAATTAIVVNSQESKSAKSAAATTTQKPINDTRDERHKAREQRRAERLAAYERFVDSIVLSRNFKFVPTSVQQEPAGSTRMLYNPNYELSVWDTEVDVCPLTALPTCSSVGALSGAVIVPSALMVTLPPFLTPPNSSPPMGSM